MPSAAQHQNDLMNLWFGDPVSEEGPCNFLFARGWTELGGMWTKPTASHTTSPYEYECLRFLHDEWDHDFFRYDIFGTNVYRDAGIT